MTVEAAVREILRIRRKSIVQLSVARNPDDSVVLVLAGTDGNEYHFPIKKNRIEDCNGNVYGALDPWVKVDMEAAIARKSAKTRKAR